MKKDFSPKARRKPLTLGALRIKFNIIYIINQEGGKGERWATT